jgi:23S rRNA pseudouridine1911/1915/1917 synthase
LHTGQNPEPEDRTLREWTVTPEQASVRLDKYLAADVRLGSRGKAASALERGKVYLNGAEATLADAARLLVAGDRVRIWTDRPGSARVRPRTGAAGDLDIVFEDDRLVVVNKPPGLLSVPLERNRGVPSVYDQLEERFRPHGKRRPLVVHRIDQDTSGLVVFAKDPAAQAYLKEQFKRREPERCYLTVVYGRPEPDAGTWRDFLVWDEKALIQKETHPRDPRGTEAITSYRVLETLRGASLLEVRLQTGRRNQVRIQARLRGHALVGEQRYVVGPDELRPISFPRHALHACRLVFRHPDDGRWIGLEAATPADFSELLSRLRRKG